MNQWVDLYIFFRVITTFWRNILPPSSGPYSLLRLHGVVIQKTTVGILPMIFSKVRRIRPGPL
jgi:hypothetical protein